MNRREFLTMGAAVAAMGCATARGKRTTAVAKAPGGGDPRMRGLFPIMTTPYLDDGTVDYESLAKEARFVADAGSQGVIWCQSGDAVDLLTFEEKKRGYETIARALAGREIMATFGCNGVDVAQALREVQAVEEVAAKCPDTHIAIISRPPDNGKTLDDVRQYYERIAAVAKRPVIIQTYVNKTCPAPTVALLVELAKKYPKTYGYIKEESEGDKANDRMVQEVAAKPAIHTVYSAWGGWQWLYQSRRCGSEGLVTERCIYAPLLVYIWQRMENGDADGTLTQAFALYRLLIDQRGFSREDMRGYALYYFKRQGLFRTTLTRQEKKAQKDKDKKDKKGKKEKTPEQVGIVGKANGRTWQLKDLTLTDRQKAELDECYDDMLRFVGKN